jgi:hypothetical protein
VQLEKAPCEGRFSLGETATWVGAALLFLSWLTTEHFLPWVSWHSEAVVFLGVLVVAWIAVAQLMRAPVARTIALPSASLPFLGLVLVAAFQRATGVLTFDGDVWVLWFYVMLCITCLTLGFAAATPPAGPGDRDMSSSFTLLAWTLLLGAVASTVVAFAQVFSLWEDSAWIARMPDLRRPGGNFGQPNHLATLQVMGVASLVYLRDSMGARARGLILFLLCAGVAATESQTGALSLLGLLCWWLLKRRTIGDTTLAWLGAGYGVAFIGMFLAWPRLLNAMDLLGYQAAVRVAEGSRRLDVWSQLLHASAMRPWTGWGFRQVVAAHNAVVDQYAVSEPYAYSHNLALDLLIWIGVPLALLFVSAAAIYLWRRARASSQLLPWYGLAVVLPLALHSMLEYPFAYAYFLAPMMLLLGAVEASTGFKPLVRLPLAPSVAVLAATTALMAWSVVEYVGIEEDFRVARFQSLGIGSPPPEHERPKVLLFDQLGLLLDGARITPTPDMSAEAMQLVKDAALHYPWSATQYRYALALALNGNPVEAARQIQVIRCMWDDKLYRGIRRKIDELAASEYPELRQLSLP